MSMSDSLERRFTQSTQRGKHWAALLKLLSTPRINYDEVYGYEKIHVHASEEERVIIISFGGIQTCRTCILAGVNIRYGDRAIENSVPIRLTEERWFHITEEHSEMAGYYFEVLETVQDPESMKVRPESYWR